MGAIQFSTDAPEYSIKIFDDLGQLIRALPKSSLPVRQIDLGDLSPGMYLFQIQANQFQNVHKLILIQQ